MEKIKTVEELRAEKAELATRNQELDSTYAGRWMDPESTTAQEFDRNDQRIAEIDKAVRQQEARTARLASYGVSVEDGDEERDFEFVGSERGATFQHVPLRRRRGEDIYDLSTVRSSVTDPLQQGKEMRERALRSVESAHIAEIDQHDDAARSKGRIEGLLRKTDSPDGRFARYMLAVGSPTYKRAFVKYLATGDASMMDRAEQASWTTGQMAYRAMSLTAANGGYAVPYELDTTILNTNNGVINPIRGLARVKQTTVDEWRGITSAGITASYVAEASETTDNSPTLAQPTVSTERAHAFAQFSIEIGMDYTSLQDDLTELFRDAKDVLEAGKFVSGTGTNEPFGVLTGTTTTVAAAAGLTITLANLYALKNALPPRYRNSGERRVPRERRDPRPVPPDGYGRLPDRRLGRQPPGRHPGPPARLPRVRGVGDHRHDHQRDEDRRLRRLLALHDPRPRGPDRRGHPAHARREPPAHRRAGCTHTGGTARRCSTPTRSAA
jgi:HK97 family phage major capsid protein